MAISRELTDAGVIEEYLEPNPYTPGPATWHLIENGVL